MGVFSRAEKRIEDGRFITGTGRYVDDIQLEGMAASYMLRSPYAHARISGIDISAALKSPGVLGILTGQNLEQAGIGHLNCMLPPVAMRNRDGSDRFDGDRPLLAVERVRCVGDGVAFVVARSLREAQEAADLIQVDYDELPAVATSQEALVQGANPVWNQAPNNVALDWHAGDKDATDAAFASATHVIALDVRQNRIVPNSMETRGAIGAYDKATGRYELYVTTQGSYPIRDRIAQQILHIPPERIHVVTPDVGGGFGMKLFLYPEYALPLIAAEKFGVPVKWISERSEAFLSDSHGREMTTKVELALDAEYRIAGLRLTSDFNIGAYASGFGPMIQTLGPATVHGGGYKIGAIYNRARAVFTNTVPVDAYRGAGRPEAAYMIERALDYAARQLGIGQDEIRLRNFIPTEDMPCKTTAGADLDSGDFARNFRDCLQNADWSTFPARRAESAKRGKLRGIGVAYYIERTASLPGGARIAFLSDGRVKLTVGTVSYGQGHETAFSQLLADQLSIPIESIVFEQGDTDRDIQGDVTGGSRSLWGSGNGILMACDTIVEKGKRVAAEMMKTSPDSIVFEEGAFRIPGSNQFVPLADAAAAARGGADLPPSLLETLPDGLDSTETYSGSHSTYPNGCHVAEIEIDPETGELKVLNYNVVDDFGFVLNPMIVRGQVLGGVAQGLGQALLENCIYEPGTAQLLSGSFMDYCMPRADDFPRVGFAYNEIRCTTHPLGSKGCGEAGTIGACPSVMNAILDALWDKGVRKIDMPMTSLRIWETLRSVS